MNIKNISTRSIAVTLASTLMLLGGTPFVAMADNPVPIITSTSPSSMVVGGSAFNVTVYGNNFIPGSVVNFNGNSRSTTYVSPTQLTAFIPASDITGTGTFSMTVTNPSPGGGTSNAQLFTVTGIYPMPILSSISPSSNMVGSGSFSLTVYGANFSPSSTVAFNGIAKPTTFVSQNQLTALIPASDVGITGTYVINVTNPVPGGGTSNAILFTVDPISVTPGLPNTGFEPMQGIASSNTLVAITAAVLGVLLAAVVIGKRIWITK